jgi:hypothetical protein
VPLFVYYLGRTLQLLGMTVLAYDVLAAGPMGPQPGPFGYGVGMFIAGWLVVRWKGGKT